MLRRHHFRLREKYEHRQALQRQESHGFSNGDRDGGNGWQDKGVRTGRKVGNSVKYSKKPSWQMARGHSQFLAT